MIQKIFIAVLNSSHRQRGTELGFMSIYGPENVGIYDFLGRQRDGLSDEQINCEFIDACVTFAPDWIWMQVQDSGIIRPSTICRVQEALPRCIVSHWTGDLRPEISPYMQSISRVADLTLISSVGQIPIFEKLGAKRVRYCQIGLDWDEDVVGTPLWTPPFRVPEVVLCGNYYPDSNFPGSPERLEAIRALKRADVNVGVVGGGWPEDIPKAGQCHVKQQHHVWKRAKVALNINHFNDIPQYYSDRQIISMASGTPVVCKYIPYLEKEFEDGVHCFWYKDTEKLVWLVKRLLGDDDLRRRIGAAGRAEVIENHTWTSRVRELHDVIVGLPQRKVQ